MKTAQNVENKGAEVYAKASAENPSHLFISYAVEDVALARRLARKLAARGHPVWLDQIKLLGGE